VRLVRTTITETFVSAAGGGLFTNGGTVEILDSFVHRNCTKAGGGGGIYAAGGTITIRRTTLAHNCTSGSGGSLLAGCASAVSGATSRPRARVTRSLIRQRIMGAS
jgi:hypothetical protein